MQVWQVEFNTMELLQFKEFVTFAQVVARLRSWYGSDYLNKNLLYIKKIEVNE